MLYLFAVLGFWVVVDELQTREVRRNSERWKRYTEVLTR